MTTPITDDGLLTISAVQTKVSLSKATIYRMINRREFPAPIKLSDSCSRWRRSSIDQWIAAMDPSTTPSMPGAMGSAAPSLAKGQTMDISKRRLEHGAKYPYDGGAEFWQDREKTPPPATDWAHAAARGVLEDLLDRRGIKWSLSDEKIDHATRSEIVQSLAAIIRLAHTLQRPS